MIITIDNTQDTLDVRDIIARVEELRDERESFEADEENAGGPSWSDENNDEALELRTLTALLEELKGNGGDEQWEGDWYPITLIRDTYFTEAMQELVEDCYEMPKDLPCFIMVDWEATARNLKVDYSSVEFDGVTYWYR